MICLVIILSLFIASWPVAWSRSAWYGPRNETLLHTAATPLLPHPMGQSLHQRFRIGPDCDLLMNWIICISPTRLRGVPNCGLITLEYLRSLLWGVMGMLSKIWGRRKEWRGEWITCARVLVLFFLICLLDLFYLCLFCWNISTRVAFSADCWVVLQQLRSNFMALLSFFSTYDNLFVSVLWTVSIHCTHTV